MEVSQPVIVVIVLLVLAAISYAIYIANKGNPVQPPCPVLHTRKQSTRRKPATKNPDAIKHHHCDEQEIEQITVDTPTRIEEEEPSNLELSEDLSQCSCDWYFPEVQVPRPLNEENLGMPSTQATGNARLTITPEAAVQALPNLSVVTQPQTRKPALRQSTQAATQAALPSSQPTTQPAATQATQPTTQPAATQAALPPAQPTTQPAVTQAARPPAQPTTQIAQPSVATQATPLPAQPANQALQPLVAAVSQQPWSTLPTGWTVADGGKLPDLTIINMDNLLPNAVNVGQQANHETQIWTQEQEGADIFKHYTPFVFQPTFNAVLPGASFLALTH